MAQPSIDQDVAEALSADIENIPGVAGFTGGPFGIVALYYPGVKLTGLDVKDGRLHVHVSYDAASHVPIPAVAQSIRDAAAHRNGLGSMPVDVFFEDAT